MDKFLSSSVLLVLFSHLTFGQVKTNYQSDRVILEDGIYKNKYQTVLLKLTPPDEQIIIAKRRDDSLSKDVRPYRIAEPIPYNLDVAKAADWTMDGDIAFMKLSLKAENAKSLSINFDNFFLPEGSEMYIYNDKGKMITGPITSSENNDLGIWGSSIYPGDILTVELRIQLKNKGDLKLNISNVAYGTQEIYGFGNSSPCNINVLCPTGDGWEQERRSVALILNQNGSIWCSGALVNNTCSDNLAYFLTANHCLNNGSENVANWRFVFQYWSPTCTPSQDNFSSLLFNGSSLKANSAGSDFALLQLNQMPPSSSGITYAGWSRASSGIQATTIIHHPAGDVMKISRDNDAPTTGTVNNAQCWQLGLDIGATNGGSSGAPYFNQNHSIIAQHFGTFNDSPDDCFNPRKFGGRFDISWTGGGTNSTRLSNWLDPGNSGITYTSTTNSPAYIKPPTTPSLTINNVSPYGAVDAQASNYSIGTYNWYRDGSFVQPGSSPYQTLPGGTCGQSHYYQVSITNICGVTSPFSQNAYYQYSCSHYRAYPNPAKSYINIEFESVNRKEDLPDQIVLLNETSSKPILSVDVQKAFDNESFKNGNIVELNVANLPRGIYYIQVKNVRNEEKPIDSIRISID